MPALLDLDLGATLDSVEIVRDQIAAILKVELANQATLTGRPQPRVFVERASPWGVFAEGSRSEPPVVNVALESMSYDGQASNIVERQKCEATYFIDAYGYGVSVEGDSGHSPGDQTAALEAQKALRLVRRILMAGPYTYLGLRGLVWRRWPQSVSMFQPQFDTRNTQHVVAGRLTLQVQFNELSPQTAGEPLETLTVEVTRSTTGEVLIAAQYPPED